MLSAKYNAESSPMTMPAILSGGCFFRDLLMNLNQAMSNAQRLILFASFHGCLLFCCPVRCAVTFRRDQLVHHPPCADRAAVDGEVDRGFVGIPV